MTLIDITTATMLVTTLVMTLVTTTTLLPLFNMTYSKGVVVVKSGERW
tara:strand:+ start:800 stop:943 length:144 start_codon:yes stop_codon:yes gene_type:complete